MNQNPLIAEVIAALRHWGHPETARGVEACARYARLWVPARGLFLPTPEGTALERIAEQHFGVAAAKRRLNAALGVVPDARQRDAIESAVWELCTGYDATHYHLGLASAFTIIGYGRSEHSARHARGRAHHPRQMTPASRRQRRA